jgi:hypothetical protein
VVQQRATLPRVLLGRRLRALRRLDRLFLANLALSLSLQVGKLARCLRLLRVLLRLPRSQRSLVLRGSLRGSSLLSSDPSLFVRDGRRQSSALLGGDSLGLLALALLLLSVLLSSQRGDRAPLLALRGAVGRGGASARCARRSGAPALHAQPAGAWWRGRAAARGREARGQRSALECSRPSQVNAGRRALPSRRTRPSAPRSAPPARRATPRAFVGDSAAGVARRGALMAASSVLGQTRRLAHSATQRGEMHAARCAERPGT